MKSDCIVFTLCKSYQISRYSNDGNNEYRSSDQLHWSPPFVLISVWFIKNVSHRECPVPLYNTIHMYNYSSWGQLLWSRVCSINIKQPESANRNLSITYSCTPVQMIKCFQTINILHLIYSLTYITVCTHTVCCQSIVFIKMCLQLLYIPLFSSSLQPTQI